MIKPHLSHYNIEKLASLWSYAVKNFALYRQISRQSGIERIATYDDWNNIPPLDKSTIKSFREYNRRDLLALFHSYSSTHTGGTSSSPVEYPLLRSDRQLIRKSLYAQRLNIIGSSCNSNYIHVWGHSHLLGKALTIRFTNNLIQSAKRSLLCIFYVNGYNPLYHFDGFLAALKSKKYVAIIGYASAIYNICRYARELNISLAYYVENVIVTAETCTLEQIDFISQTFSSNVFREYGMAELGVLAYAKNDQPYQFESSLHLLEFSDPTSSSTSSLLVTTLQRSFPLIKYKVDDIFADVAFSDLSETYTCSHITGRPLLPIYVHSNNSLKGPFNEVFFVHLFKQLPEVYQVTSFIDSSSLLFRVNLYCPGYSSSCSSLIILKAKRLLLQEISEISLSSIEVTISSIPYTSQAGKSINLVIA